MSSEKSWKSSSGATGVFAEPQGNPVCGRARAQQGKRVQRGEAVRIGGRLQIGLLQVARKEAVLEGDLRHVLVGRSQANLSRGEQDLRRGTVPAGFGGRAEGQARAPHHADFGPGVDHPPQEAELRAVGTPVDGREPDGSGLRSQGAQPEIVHGRDLPQVRERLEGLPERSHRSL